MCKHPNLNSFPVGSLQNNFQFQAEPSFFIQLSSWKQPSFNFYQWDPLGIYILKKYNRYKNSKHKHQKR